MEKINYVLGFDNIKIYQDSDSFKFTLDSILLANFVKPNRNTKILDIGTGSCIIPIILSNKVDTIDAIEIQKKQYDLAIKSLKYNEIKNINLINDDINNYYKQIETETYDLITCNPPYFKVDKDSHLNLSEEKSVARHEIKLTLNNIFKISKKILKNNGNISIVHRPDRMIEIIEKMKLNNIEPKELRFIYPKEGRESNLILISGKKNGNPGIKILSPLVIHKEDGSYTDEVKEYFRK